MTLLLAIALAVQSPMPASAANAAAHQVIDAGLSAGFVDWDSYVIAYWQPSRVVIINRHHAYWRNPAGWQAAHKGDFSTQSPDHVIRHELAHDAMFKRIGWKAMDIIGRAPPPMDLDRVKRLVSKYAATSGAEFWAEVHVGLEAGKAYPKDVMDTYNYLGRTE